MHRYTIGMKREQDTDREILARQAWEIWDDKAKPQLSANGRLEQISPVDMYACAVNCFPQLGIRLTMLLLRADHGIVEEKGFVQSSGNSPGSSARNFACRRSAMHVVPAHGRP